MNYFVDTEFEEDVGMKKYCGIAFAFTMICANFAFEIMEETKTNNSSEDEAKEAQLAGMTEEQKVQEMKRREISEAEDARVYKKGMTYKRVGYGIAAGALVMWLIYFLIDKASWGWLFLLIPLACFTFFTNYTEAKKTEKEAREDFLTSNQMYVILGVLMWIVDLGFLTNWFDWILE
jgi:surface polysaccharide O-acyltransferase-like enzyme